MSGTVTLNGREVQTGVIEFHSLGDGKDIARDVIEHGEYRLTTFLPDDGAVPGKHRVVVKSPPDLVVGAVPEKYGDPATSDLTVEVNPGVNQIPIKLGTDAEAP